MRHRTFLSLLTFCLLPTLTVGECDWQMGQEPNPSYPVFSYPAWTKSVSFNTTTGEEILEVYATDADINDTLSYSIEPFPFDSYVTIDSENGTIRAAQSFEDIDAVRLVFTVLVQDREELNDPEVKTDRAEVTLQLFHLE